MQDHGAYLFVVLPGGAGKDSIGAGMFRKPTIVVYNVQYFPPETYSKPSLDTLLGLALRHCYLNLIQ